MLLSESELAEGVHIVTLKKAPAVLTTTLITVIHEALVCVVLVWVSDSLKIA
jgi:hypothetical protein